MAFATYPSLAGKHVHITGGGSGIGAALCREYVAQGAKVSTLSRNEAELRKTAETAPGLWWRSGDVTDVAGFTKVLADAAEALGPVDVLVNNVANDTRHKAIETDVDAWHKGLAVNLDPVFVACRAVYPAMKARGAGAIVNISSVNALLGPPDMVTYVAAKGAINAMTKSLAREWGPDNIRVNVLTPGWIITERQLKLWLTPEAEQEWMELVALKRRIMPEDVAQLCMFLSADDSALITGQNFVIDGGRT